MAERLCDQIAMVFRGRKVLDGTLEQIQAAHGRDSVHLELAEGSSVLEGIAGVTVVRDEGRKLEVELTIAPRALLAELAARTDVLRFERARPSLHDIFVRIARPDEPSTADEVPLA
jgi:ABC-2 type transport system ATP-binding protein